MCPLYLRGDSVYDIRRNVPSLSMNVYCFLFLLYVEVENAIYSKLILYVLYSSANISNPYIICIITQRLIVLANELRHEIRENIVCICYIPTDSYIKYIIYLQLTSPVHLFYVFN